MKLPVGDQVRTSLVTGASAWLAGIAFAAVILALFSSVPSTPVALLASATVFYYTFHLWPLVLVPADLSATAAVFAPVAILLLFWAGFRAAIRADVATARAGFRRGASVAVGYGGLAVLSLVAFERRLETSVVADPAVTVAMVATTAVLFPVVFGGFGGWMAGR